MANFKLTNLDWDSFEKQFNILRTDIVEVSHMFRSNSRVYSLNSDLKIWDEKRANSEFNKNAKIIFYYINDKMIWRKTTLEY